MQAFCLDVASSMYVCVAHASGCRVHVCVCVCVCVCVHVVLKLFLEAAAVESINHSARTDIPRMPSLVSDPSGENIGQTRKTHTHKQEEVAFHHLFRRATCIQRGRIVL